MRVWAALVLVAGCYRPAPEEGTPCSPLGECPSPLTCSSDGRCVREGADAPSDMAIDVMPDADLTCSCAGPTMLHCASGDTACTLGCSMAPAAHCKQVVPSNGVDAALAGAVSSPLGVANGSTVVCDTDTGQITGDFTRAAGEGVINDVGFKKHMHFGRAIGLFYVSSLDVNPTGLVRFKGSAAAALLVRHTLTVDGRIDVSAGCGGTDRTCAGPGGAPGTRIGTMVTNPCSGKNGETDNVNNSDAGGGGGGAGMVGAKGGDASTFLGGAAGSACLAQQLEPLIGGGGGGGGGNGANALGPPGGGGGGGLQLTALEGIAISGVVSANGSGGAGGAGSGAAADGDAAGGGGAGGAVLIEAPTVNIGGAVLVANGGGGGGAANSAQAGQPGEDGKLSASPAIGGATGAAPSTAGGNGGAGSTAATFGPNTGQNQNAGGGGGGVGRIFVRGTTTGVATTTSPPATSGALATR